MPRNSESHLTLHENKIYNSPSRVSDSFLSVGRKPWGQVCEVGPISSLFRAVQGSSIGTTF